MALDGRRCRWIVIHPDNEQVDCTLSDVTIDVSEVKFNLDGNIYYSDQSENIYLRDHMTGEIALLFSGHDIDFAIDDFLPDSEGGLVLSGVMEGTFQKFFRKIPGDGMEELCVRSVRTHLNGHSSGGEMLLSTSGDIYVRANGIGADCEGSDSARVFKGRIVDGALTFIPIHGVDADFFIEDGDGHVYAVIQADSWDQTGTLTRVSDGPPDVVTLDFVNEDLFEVHGDCVYVSGERTVGNHVLVRRCLSEAVSGTTDEETLIDGKSLIIQNFHVSPSGIIYFSALDLITLEHKFYSYDDSTGLNDLAYLPNEKLEFIVPLQ